MKGESYCRRCHSCIAESDYAERMQAIVKHRAYRAAHPAA